MEPMRSHPPQPQGLNTEGGGAPSTKGGAVRSGRWAGRKRSRPLPRSSKLLRCLHTPSPQPSPPARRFSPASTAPRRPPLHPVRPGPRAPLSPEPAASPAARPRHPRSDSTVWSFRTSPCGIRCRVPWNQPPQSHAHPPHPSSLQDHTRPGTTAHLASRLCSQIRCLRPRQYQPPPLKNSQCFHFA